MTENETNGICRKFRWRKFSVLIVWAFLISACQSESANSQSGLRGYGPSVEIFMPERVRIIYKRSCESCHGIDGGGITGIAPDIKRAKRRSAEEWRKYLRSPLGAHPASQKPPLWLDEEEVETISDFLADLSQGSNR